MNDLRQAAQQAQQTEPVRDLYWRLHNLSKALEGSGRIDADDYPDAYKTILDSMALAQQAEPERNFCPRCGKRLASDGIHTCTPPQTKCSHCASPLFAALECRVCGRKEAK